VSRLLIVHHTVSPAMHELLVAVLDGARDPAIEGVEVVEQPALHATAADVLEADGYLLGAPANLGYMAGALKHFFDQIYYPCVESTRGRPFAFYLHGNDDTEGARHGVEKITTGLQWRAVAAPVQVVGAPDAAARDACRDLGGVLAATLAD
jgi:NAD(P)H-dependent FMN reductase